MNRVAVRGAEILATLKGGGRSHFLRNFLVLLTGTALAQFITVLATPLLTRLYDPADFGVFGVYASIASIFGAVPTLRFDQALMLPKRSEDAMNLFVVSWLCVLGISLLTALVCIPFGGSLALIVRSQDLLRWTWLIPLSVFFSGTYQTFASWSARQKQFHRSSISQVVRSATQASSQSIAGALDAGPLGLVGGTFIADAIASLTLGTQVFKTDSSLFRNSICTSEMKRLAKEYAEFPVYGSTQAMLNTLSQCIPLLLLSHYFGMITVGLYSLGVRILQLPMNLVLTSLRQVLFQKASEVYNNGGDTYALFKKTTLGLLAIAIGPAAIVVLFAPPAFAFVLGQEWYMAGEYARWLILWLAVSFVNPPAMLLAQVYRKQQVLLRQDLLLLACRVTALVVGGMYLSDLQTVILYSMVGVAFNAYIIFWMWQFLRHCQTHFEAAEPPI